MDKIQSALDSIDNLMLIIIKDMTSVESDLLLSVLLKVLENDYKDTAIDFKAIRELSHYKRSNSPSFLKEQLKKVLGEAMNIKVKFDKMSMFSDCDIDLKNQIVKVNIDDKNRLVIKKALWNLDKSKIKEFISVRSVYSKRMYLLLNYYHKTGLIIYGIDEFKILLNIPQSYKMGNITQKVIDPILRELRPYFKWLKIKTSKSRTKIGSYKTDKIRFSYKAETN